MDLPRTYLAAATVFAENAGSRQTVRKCCHASMQWIRIFPLHFPQRAKITAAGNIAGSGSKMLALNKEQLALPQKLVTQVKFLELASLPAFQRTFAKNMSFREG